MILFKAKRETDIDIDNRQLFSFSYISSSERIITLVFIFIQSRSFVLCDGAATVFRWQDRHRRLIKSKNRMVINDKWRPIAMTP